MRHLWPAALLIVAATSACDVLTGLSDFSTEDGTGGMAATGGGGERETPASSTSSAGGMAGTGGVVGTGGQPDLEVAEELLVDLRAEDWVQDAPWFNRGTLGDAFDPDGPIPPHAQVRDGRDAACFDDESAFVGPVTPATLVGSDSRSVEVWVINDQLKPEETMVSWGYRNTNNRLMSFNYGTNDTYGAVGHYGLDLDLGWMPEPAPGQWHHLVYTFDGSQLRIFADGVLNQQRNLSGLDTFPDEPIVLGAQWEVPDELYFSAAIGAELCLGVVRIHAGALTAGQVKMNYDVERARYED